MTRPGRPGTESLGALALLALTMGWGSTFFMTKDLLSRVPVLDYLGVRFAIAVIALLVVAPRAVLGLPRPALARSLLLGAVYGLAQILQTTGLDRTPASTAGFVTGLYVVMTPLLAAPLLRQRIPAAARIAVVLATAGMAVLSLRGLQVGAGELLVLASALLYALHICGLGAWSTPETSMGSSIVQLGVIAVICLAGAAPGGLTLPHTGVDWARMAYMGVVVGALGMLAQVWAQAHLPPTRSAVIMSMEPVFAALFAVLFGGESATLRMMVGGVMVLAAMLLVELAPRRKVESEVLHPAQ
ncbi:DMT family transporter [Nocardioides sp. BP30]|uniref:DMT family transporter n=1 Tax=Nocardioides sp. BP30 TaxID=3036374 RepID=UPI002468EE67|nr:DMT family transporter [Nocardioides sp. BP30]WGL53839.1 DMT family transporter [Nocardioides sp. BP30]